MTFDACESIGTHGLGILKAIVCDRPIRTDLEHPLNILTHCNAGWLAALAPIYKAYEAGLPVHVWVGEVIVGSDRTTATVDVRNKIGTYLKGLTARNNGLPFTVAPLLSTIAWSISDELANSNRRTWF